MKTTVLTVTAILSLTAAILAEPATSKLSADSRDALLAGLDDERRAEAFYKAVIAGHGEVLPFAHVVQAEARHQQMLLSLLGKYEVTVPTNRWNTERFIIPDTVAAACKEAATMEKANIALYDKLLQTVKETDVQNAFTRLRAMSKERHLRAFEAAANGQPCGGDCKNDARAGRCGAKCGG